MHATGDGLQWSRPLQAVTELISVGASRASDAHLDVLGCAASCTRARQLHLALTHPARPARVEAVSVTVVALKLAAGSVLEVPARLASRAPHG